MAENRVRVTNYSVSGGLGSLIRQRQQGLGAEREQLMLLIKPSAASNYSNLINALDEALIHAVKRYAVVDLTAGEQEYLRRGAKTNGG